MPNIAHKIEGLRGDAIVHVLDAQGNIIKPSDLWVHMGMQHQTAVDSLVIDDLCDQMKAKATCKEGEYFVTSTIREDED